MKRIFLFVATNLLVVLTVSLAINLLGIRPYLGRSGIDPQGLLIFCALFGFAGSFLSLQLSRWTAKMGMGVQLIDPKRPGGEHAAWLVDRVRNLCQAAGLDSLPEIGVYDSPEVNAFATGPSQRRALLAVSTGLLESMDDRAVEGVLGHEVSHIANGDMVTMALIQGVVNTFVMFFARIAAFAIDQALRSRDERRGGGLPYFEHYLLISLFETLFMLLAAPLVYGFSRHREYRADAGGARLSGRETMIHALESLARAAGAHDHRAPTLSVYKINGGAEGWLARLFASHPPIAKRIEALRNRPV